MEFLPISWRLQGKVALLAGGGEVALRKGRLLHRSGAILTVVAPQVCDELRDIVVRSGGPAWSGRLKAQIWTGSQIGRAHV